MLPLSLQIGFDLSFPASHYVCVSVCVCVKSLQSCLTLCDPMNYSSPGSSVHGILQARILEQVVILFSRGFYDAGIDPSPIAGKFFTI